jgi:4,5-dihydroxyphthalate decarboxylase
MSRLPLTLALNHYDHTADLANGRVPVEGVDLNVLTLRVEEIFFRFIVHRDFDVSEVSLAKYASMIAQGDTSLIAIPVFPSRVPRHSSIYVRSDGPIKAPADLAGRRIGLPEWAQTAAVYSRGLLAHQYGIDLAGIDWVQAGVDQPGRIEKVKLSLPGGLRVTPAPDKTLNDMLLSGEIDAALTAGPPQCVREGNPAIRRLFENPLEAETAYVRETGIFPIMHTVAMRREVFDRRPWVAMNLFTAFEEAKRRSVERALFSGASAFPIPWFYEHARRAQELLGGDLWPYGIEKNRVTLEAFLQYAHEQGVCARKLAPEDLFAKQVQSAYRV